MANTRLKVASQDAKEDGSIVLTAYSDPDDSGKQPVTGNATFDVSKLPNVAYLAARGFGLIVAGQYIKNDGSHADPLTTSHRVYDEMLAGTWTPGRPAGPAEPSAFAEALSQLSGHPVHLVVQDMENKDKWTKSYMATVRRDPRVAALVAKIEKDRATAKEAEARQRAKGVSGGALDIGSLFAASGAPGDAVEQAAAD